MAEKVYRSITEIMNTVLDNYKHETAAQKKLM
jgi:hypothetical protein